MAALEIGSMSRDGLLQIVDTNWDHNGTLRVTVRELIGNRPGRWGGGWTISPNALTNRMRRLARRALDHPEHTRSARLVRRFHAESCDYATFNISRIGD